MTNGVTEFDYIIIGAGSAGCILAGRLGEIPGVRILVLEAGGSDWNPLIHIPFGVAKVWNNPKLNWSYNSEPEPFLNNRILYHPRGKVVGGSAAINMMAYVRGGASDYDHWAQNGLSGWSYSEVLPYFKRNEQFLGGETEYRGGNGSIKTRPAKSRDPFLKSWFEAGQSAGYPVLEDYNSTMGEGIARIQLNISQSRRSNSAREYLKPALKQGNVKLITRAQVNRIRIVDRRAEGVDYQVDGRLESATAKREVILAAGAYNSPKLLMLSGIGDGEQLQNLGIEPVLDNARVGANLQDHPALPVDYQRLGECAFHENLRLDKLTINMLKAWFIGTGPATDPASFSTGFFKSRREIESPDIQLFLRLFSPQAREWFPGIRPPKPVGFGFVYCHLRPESRGTVSIGSPDPNDPPRILNNFLSTPNDQEALRTGLKIIRSIVSQPALQDVAGKELVPGNQVTSDEEIDQYVRDQVRTVFHPCGTCRMGADPESVVDPELRVRNIAKLRVVDASIFPNIVSGNINACTMMVAEKASDLIKKP
ncbi:MAG: GMC family oxidoreductase [Methyloligellaceae bacterium]